MNIVSAYLMMQHTHLVTRNVYPSSVYIKKLYNIKDTWTVDIYSRELHILQLLSGHRNIINFVGTSHNDDSIDIYLEECQCDLSELMDTSFKILPKHKMDLLQGVAHIHRHGIIHRDLKPQNIVYDAMNDCLKIIDFGISRAVTNSIGQVNASTQLWGTCHVVTLDYRSPELLIRNACGVGTTLYGYEVDIWSLGCILYLMETSTPIWSYPDDPMDITESCMQMLRIIESHHGSIPLNIIESYLNGFSDSEDNVTLAQYIRFSAKYPSIPSESLLEPVNSFHALLMRIFEYDPSRRPTISEILDDRWTLSQLPTPPSHVISRVDRPYCDMRSSMKHGIKKFNELRALVSTYTNELDDPPLYTSHIIFIESIYILYQAFIARTSITQHMLLACMKIAISTRFPQIACEDTTDIVRLALPKKKCTTAFTDKIDKLAIHIISETGYDRCTLTPNDIIIPLCVSMQITDHDVIKRVYKRVSTYIYTYKMHRHACDAIVRRAIKREASTLENRL